MTLIEKLNTAISVTVSKKNDTNNWHYRKTFPISMPRYKELLVNNLCIHESLEKEIEHTLLQFSHSPLHDFFHSKTEWIRNDLKMVGMQSPYAFPTVFTAPQIGTISELIGTLYVIEGSMLGGRMLYNYLRREKELIEIPDFLFYKNYDKEIDYRWRYLHQLAEQYTAHHQEAIVATRQTIQFMNEIMNGVNVRQVSRFVA